MQVLKQSTAATILVGPVLDADGAAYTAAVIGDFNVTKNGSTAAMASAATATHDHNGMYLIALTTGNTDTLGRLDISMNKATYGMTNHRYEVLTANQFDALVTNGTVTPASIQSGLATSSGVTSAFAEIKGAGWSSGTDTLEEIADAIAAINVGSGTGARTVTVTVNDGTIALQNATVRMTSGAETYTALTNVSGVAVFNLDDATWVVSITRNGYSFAGTTLVVDGTETVTYSMSIVTINASSVNKVTGYWTVLDENGNAAASVVVTIKARQPTRTSSGVIHDAGERTATSNGAGLVQFTNMLPGWRYAVVANDEYVADFVVPADAVTSVELGSIVARLP